MIIFKQHFAQNTDFSNLCWTSFDNKYLELGLNIVPLSYNNQYIFKFLIGNEEIIFYYDKGYHVRYSSKDFQIIKIINLSLIPYFYFKFVYINSVLSVLFSTNGLLYEDIVDLNFSYDFNIKVESSGNNILNIVHSEIGNL